MAEEVAALNVRLEANIARFEQQVQKARKTLDRQAGRMESRLKRTDDRFAQFGARFGKQLIAGLGAFAGAAGARRLASSFQETLDRLDSIAKAADKLGLTTEALQELRFAAEQSGVATRTFDMAFQRFTRRAAEAANGTGEAKAALEELNISLRDSDGRMRSMETLFDEVADALSQVESQSDRVRLAFKLFDSEGVAVLNMLQNGSEAMNRLREEARDLGLVLKDDLVRDAVKMKDELSKVFQIIGREWDRLLLTFARGLDRIFNFIPDTLGEKVSELREIQDTLSRRAAGTGFENFLAGPTTELERRQDQLLKEIRVMEDLRRAREGLTRTDITPGGGGGGGGGSKRDEQAKTIQDVLRLLEEEIAKLDQRAAMMRMNEAEAARFRAETEALNKAKELGIDLDATAANSNRTNRELIALWAGDVADATERVNAMKEAMDEARRAQDEQGRSAEESARAMQSIGESMASTILEARNLSDALRGLEQILFRLLSQQVSGAFGNLLSGALGSIFGGPTAVSVGGGLTAVAPSARGNVFSGGSVVPFARGGVVSRPTTFPMANGVGLMGEAGAEAVLPLKRGPGGRLGVEGGGSNVSVEVVNTTGAPVREDRQQTADGQRIRILIGEMVAEEMGRPGSPVQRALSTGYGARPVTRRR